MGATNRLGWAAVAALSCALPVIAHHSFAAELDSCKTVTLLIMDHTRKMATNQPGAFRERRFPRLPGLSSCSKPLSPCLIGIRIHGGRPRSQTLGSILPRSFARPGVIRKFCRGVVHSTGCHFDCHLALTTRNSRNIVRRIGALHRIRAVHAPAVRKGNRPCGITGFVVVRSCSRRS